MVRTLKNKADRLVSDETPTTMLREHTLQPVFESLLQDLKRMAIRKDRNCILNKPHKPPRKTNMKNKKRFPHYKMPSQQHQLEGYIVQELGDPSDPLYHNSHPPKTTTVGIQKTNLRDHLIRPYFPPSRSNPATPCHRSKPGHHTKPLFPYTKRDPAQDGSIHHGGTDTAKPGPPTSIPKPKYLDTSSKKTGLHSCNTF